VVVIYILSCRRLSQLFDFTVYTFSGLLLLLGLIHICSRLKLLEVLLRYRVDYHQTLIYTFLWFWLMTNSIRWCDSSTRSSLQDLMFRSLQLKYLLPRLPLYFILNLRTSLLLRTQLQRIGYLLIIRNLKLLKIALLHLILIIFIYSFHDLIQLNLLHVTLFQIKELGRKQSNFFPLSFQASFLLLGVRTALLLDEAGSTHFGFGLIVTTYVCA
jgi:hypothetical protein